MLENSCAHSRAKSRHSKQAPGSKLQETIFEKRRKRLKNPMSRLQELRFTVPFKSNRKAVCLTCYFISCPVCTLSVCVQKQGASPYFPGWVCPKGVLCGCWASRRGQPGCAASDTRWASQPPKSFWAAPMADYFLLPDFMYSQPLSF